MKKPFSIKLINIVLISKLVVISLVFVFTILMFTINSTDVGSAFYNFQKGYIESAGFTRDDLANGGLISEYLGSLFFDFSSTLTLVILSIIFLKRRKYNASIVTFSLQIFLSFNNLISLLLSITLLILLISNKKYIVGHTYKLLDENG